MFGSTRDSRKAPVRRTHRLHSKTHRIIAGYWACSFAPCSRKEWANIERRKRRLFYHNSRRSHGWRQPAPTSERTTREGMHLGWEHTGERLERCTGWRQRWRVTHDQQARAQRSPTRRRLDSRNSGQLDRVDGDITQSVFDAKADRATRSTPALPARCEGFGVVDADLELCSRSLCGEVALAHQAHAERRSSWKFLPKKKKSCWLVVRAHLDRRKSEAGAIAH